MVSKLHISILKEIVVSEYRKQKISDPVDFDLPISEAHLLSELNDLLKLQLIIFDETTYKLTDRGRKELCIVFTGGAFDLLHPGHLLTLNEAASLGDILVVVIARDVTIQKNKRDPIHSETERQNLINSLKMVDIALLGDESDHLKIVEQIRPNVIAIGADQFHRLRELEVDLEKRGLTGISFTRLTSDHEEKSTTHLIDVIRSKTDL